MKKTIITALLAIVATLTAKAQLTDWQNISSKNFVMKIIHDENYLYVGTKGGGLVKIDKQSGEQTVLKRADGSMTGNSITDMALHNGELWVGTEFNGLAKVTDDSFERFDKRNAGFRINQYFSGFYFNADGTMLVGSIASLYVFDGKKCTAVYDINPISYYTYVKKIRADRDGRIWVACYDALNKYNLCVFTPSDLVPYNIPYGRVYNIETEKDGCLWIATNKGLVKFDGTDFTHYTPDNSALPEANIADITADENGNLWMLSEHNITKFDGTNFTAYPYQLNVANDYLLTIDAADDNNVYVGSRFEGLLWLTDNGLAAIPLTDNQLYDSGISYSSGCIDGNGIFYGATTNGLQTYNIDTNECHFEPMGVIVQTEADLSGNVWLLWNWASTDTCLVEISATGKKAYLRTDYPFTEANADLIKFDRKSRLWIAMNKGLYMRDGETWTVFNKSNSILSEIVQSMAFDSNNRLWCGTFGSGLFLFDGSKWTQYTTKNSQLPSDYVGFVAVDNDDVLWLNCRDPQYPDKMGSEFGLGLTRFDGNTWTTYNCNNSPLPSNCFWDVQVDADNRKWLAAGDFGVVGLTCFDGTEWTIYNTDNSGIVLNEVTKITLDPKRDLIWLTHHPGLGLSVARLNSHNTAIQSVAAATAKSGQRYNLMGQPVDKDYKGIVIEDGKKIVVR